MISRKRGQDRGEGAVSALETQEGHTTDVQGLRQEGARAQQHARTAYHVHMQ